MEVEGDSAALHDFLRRLRAEAPVHCQLTDVDLVWLPAAGYDSFVIRDSQDDAHPTALVLPDIATCAECLAEIFDPANRRYRYPFTNCTQCGPRFTIIEALPYDRERTSMKRFAMCSVMSYSSISSLTACAITVLRTAGNSESRESDGSLHAERPALARR